MPSISQPIATKRHYHCPDCADRELIIEQDENGRPVAIPCRCKEIKHLHRLIKSSGLTQKQRLMTLDNYKTRPATVGMFKIVQNYLRNFAKILDSPDYNKGIGLSGTVGTGKTHLMLAVANALLQRRVPVVFVNTPDLIAELLEAQFERENSGLGLNAKINQLGQAKVAIFDDVGKEKVSEWVQTQYFRIINRRYERGLPTLFSSNYSLDEIAKKIGDATASRLYALTKSRQVYVKASDYRLMR